MLDVFTAKVRDLSAKGLGVADHPDGMVFFIEGTVPGDIGEFEVLTRDKRYGFARLRTLLNASPDRIRAVCAHHGFGDESCHGCPWMMIDYSVQLKHKQLFIEQYLQRQGLFDPSTVVMPMHASPKTEGYRNRAQLKSDGTRLGYVAPGPRKQIVDIERCVVLNDTNQRMLQTLRDSLPNNSWKPKEGRDWVAIDIDDKAQEISADKKLPFRQGNTEQNDFMKAWLKQQCEMLGTLGEVLELFCGSGNFTEVLLPYAKRILAVEGSNAAIASLNAQRWQQTTGVVLDLFKVQNLEKLKHMSIKPETLVLDPPRTGFKLLPHLTAAHPSLRHIFYISCDVASFSHDTRTIGDQGFKLKFVQGLDQFPHTPHAELLSLFTKD